MKKLLIAALLTGFSVASFAMSPPAGWSRTVRAGVESYIPNDLQSGERYEVSLFAPTVLDGRDPAQWLETWAAGKIPGRMLAKLHAELANEKQTASAFVGFEDDARNQLIALFFAQAYGNNRVRGMRIILSQSSDLIQRYKSVVKVFTAQLGRDEADAKPAGNSDAPRSDYVAKQRATTEMAQQAGGVPAGSRRGGPFRYGTYDFVMPLPAINQVSRYRISFYENGEWRKDEETETFKYDSETGALNIDVLLNLYNSTYDETQYCRFYLTPDGTPLIYAEDNYGTGTHRITGHYVGPNNRPSPSEEKTRKASAATESARFKWITQPGHGVRSEQIAGMLWQLQQVYRIGGLQLDEHIYLLLNDGSAYRGLRCAPDQLDVGQSRSNEPKNWGRWRKSGTGYELQFPGASGPGPWQSPRMTSLVEPGRTGERLNGRFETSSSFQIPGGAGSVSHRGITFTPDGRFRTDFSNQTGGTMGYGEQTVAAQTISDDEGSSTSVSAANFGGGSTRKRPNSMADRSGGYGIAGYVLVLKYDNGRVERLPFFFNNAKRNEIWFRDATYSLPKE